LKVIVGADHAGYPGKAGVITCLRELGHEVVDVGTHSEEPVDFPDIVRTVTTLVLSGEGARGILVCGTGIGAAMAANKVRGIRAALAPAVSAAHHCVEHDDANVLCLGAQVVGPNLMGDLVRTWMAARFLPDEEFRRRLEKLAQLEAGE
jgi:ribose 5-phosphate isomerase B